MCGEPLILVPQLGLGGVCPQLLTIHWLSSFQATYGYQPLITWTVYFGCCLLDHPLYFFNTCFVNYCLLLPCILWITSNINAAGDRVFHSALIQAPIIDARSENVLFFLQKKKRYSVSDKG